MAPNAAMLSFCPIGSLISSGRYSGVVSMIPAASTKGTEISTQADMRPSAESVLTLRWKRKRPRISRLRRSSTSVRLPPVSRWMRMLVTSIITVMLGTRSSRPSMARRTSLP